MSIKLLVKFASKSFTLPDTCVRLREALDNPKADLDDVGRIIAVDPSLSAKVLRLANSALFRFPAQIETIPKALNVIGGEAAYNISIAETANIAFKKFAHDDLDFDVFWENAVMTGLIAKSIAQQKQMRGSDRFFAIGVIQSLSELLAALKLPEKYTAYRANGQLRVPIHTQEEVFKFSFPNCTGEVLAEWQLPQSLVLPLQSIDAAPRAELGLDEAVVYVALAMQFAQQHNIAFEHLKHFNASTTELLNLSDDEYEMILNFAKLETTKIAQMINN